VGADVWEVFHTGFTANNINDGHDCISFGIDGLGHMHLSWGMHGDPFHYARSLAPVTGANEIAFGPDGTMTGKENSVTYPQFLTLPNGDLLYFFREGGSGNGDLFLNRYRIASQSWSNVHLSGTKQLAFIKGTGFTPNYNAYWQKPCIDANGNIHMAWTWRYNSDSPAGEVGYQTNHDFAYAWSPDEGVTWKWPEGTRIEAIRVVRLFPKSTFHMNEPMVGAGAESLTRGVIGTAPVEADGSAHFKVPTGVPIYFQALDEDGLAVQSMRSATCVHPGERLSCVGCHEPKQQTPSQTAGTPLAWQQAPAILQPESSDALAISFPRLVQPVLDKHCTSCHAGPDAITAGAPDLSGRLTGPHGWSAAFTALKPHAWAHNGGNGIIFMEGARSEAGKIGARASRLLTYLSSAHYEVRLDPEEMRRITLWLDCNSNYYGAYHDLQAQGKVFIVTPDGGAVWEHPAPNCNDLWVLPGGNLLFNTGHGVKEVTRDKQVVFNYQSKSEIYACQRLENGDTFIAECNSGRLLEVKPDGTTSDRVSSRFHVPAWRGWPRRSVCPSGRTFSRSQGNDIRHSRRRVSTALLRRG
jgi:hypothetical protein